LRGAGVGATFAEGRCALAAAVLALAPICGAALVCDDADDAAPESDGSALATADVVRAATPSPRPTVSAVPHEADLLDPIDFRPNLSTRVCAPMRAG